MSSRKVAGNLTKNSTLLADLESEFDSWRLLAEDDHQSTSLTKLKQKKPLAVLSGAKTILQCLYTMNHNMVFEDIL
jgi:hypothetical protein